MRIDPFCLQRYTEWANGRLLEALRACPAAEPEGLPLLAHVLGAEHTWLSRIQDRPVVHPVKPTLTLAECEALARDNTAALAAVLTGRDEAGWAEVCRYRNSAGDAFETRVGDILMQVFMHGAYHRGQIARAVGRAGVPAVNTDLITFLRETGGSVLG